MTTDNPYDIDRATLPPELLADIAVAVDYLAMRPDENDKARLERLRRFIEPPPPPECGWRPEGVTQAADTLRAYGASTSADHLLVKVRCTLPAGHHAARTNNGVPSCCAALYNDPIHCGHEHRIDKWVKP
jgi:hypothetical protein